MASTSSSGTFSRLLWMSTVVAVLSVAVYAILYYRHSAKYTIVYPDNVNVTDKLINLHKISVEPYSGCESIVFHNGSLYTGALGGKILKIDENGAQVFSQFGESGCASMSICGRPLGVRLSHDNNHLIVADSYLGLFSVSLSDGTSRKLFPTNDQFRVTFFNDFDVLPNGTIVLSETSTKHPLENILRIVFEVQPSGRLLSIDPSTGQWRQLLDELHFPNGVQLHSDEQSVLVVEGSMNRILRVPLDGGLVTVFADDLPGIPDNIRRSPRGGYWVPLNNVKTFPRSYILDLPRHFSLIRTIIVKLSETSWFHGLRHTKSAMLVRLNDDGKMIEVIRDPTNTVPNIAEVAEHDGVLYTGTYFLPYIGRLNI